MYFCLSSRLHFHNPLIRPQRLQMFWTVRKATRQFMNGGPSSQTNGSGGFFRDKAKSSANGPSSSSTAKERKEEEHRDKNGRFFERDEGEYVDYEEVKD